MIELKIDPYCNDCPEFEPVVDRDIREYTNLDMRSDGRKTFTECDTTIICTHKLRCKSMMNQLKKEQEKS